SLLLFAVLILSTACGASSASAQACKRDGSIVTCDDGRQGVLADTSIIWTDGTRSHSATPHPSVIIGNKSSVHVGQGVYVGNGKGGKMPLNDRSVTDK